MKSREALYAGGRRRSPITALRGIGVAAPVLAMAFAPQIAAPQAAKPLASPAGTFEKTVRPFLVAHCISCHNAKNAAAGLNLEAFSDASAVAREPHVWDNVVQKIHTGQMPPPGSPRPDPGQAKIVTAWIEREADRARSRVAPSPGRVTARRLNRAEYDNTIRDLLGVDIHPADDFPQDDSGYGFDNIGDVLSLSPPLLEKYLNAAEKVTRTALFGSERLKPSLTQVRMPRRETPPNTNLPAIYDTSGLTLPNAVHASYQFPVNADYALGVILTGQRPAGSAPMRLGLWIDGKRVAQTTFDPEGSASFEGEPQELAGQTVHFAPVRVPAGEHWVAVTMLRMYEGLPPSYNGPNPSKRVEPKPPSPDDPRRAKFFAVPPDATPEQKAEIQTRRETFLKRQQEQRQTLANAAKLFVLEIGGPYHQETGPPPAAHALLYTCGHHDGKHNPGCARKILTDFTHRAFRRPVGTAEVDRYVRLFNLARQQGDSFDEGLCVALQAVLVSPHFLFRIEHDAPAGRPAAVAGMHPITDHELASRLSYFLWSSMPDAELLRCADTGKLHQPAVLDAQVRRMLRDPRAHALAENFAGQWLELRKLESLKPDLDRFPAFDEYLRLSMRQETEQFFDNVVREDRSVLDFLDGDYTFVNERLAKFYGIPGVQGPEFRQVSLAATPRRGVLTQASVLTVSSYATRTSPVLRGKWILDNILDAPPPPPPPNVPSLDETKIAAGASLRQQLEAHRANTLCASCHSRMDPLGFALENFDAVGGWRTRDGETAIDASGQLPDGRKFRGSKELVRVLKTDRDAFTRCLTEKMLTYALGRGLEPYDRPAIDAITARVKKDDYRFSGLVSGIVGSLPFRQRKG